MLDLISEESVKALIMFKFNFSNEYDNSDEKDLQRNTVVWYDCKKVEITSQLKEKLKNVTENEIIQLKYGGNITLSCLSSVSITNKMKEEREYQLSDALEAEKNHSDLIPGKYEGGLKIWECTRDLIHYLLQKNISFNGKKILDLGCGAGIIGITAVLKGASVTFQDYNREVLELITIPNLFLNVGNDGGSDRTEFYSGDWGSFVDVLLQNNKTKCRETNESSLENDKFDYIYSSETIYNSFNYFKIYNIVKNLMKIDGTCYIASKKFYFGVGGNTHSFIEYFKRENVFDVEICWFSNEGVAREILKISFK